MTLLNIPTGTPRSSDHNYTLVDLGQFIEFEQTTLLLTGHTECTVSEHWGWGYYERILAIAFMSINRILDCETVRYSVNEDTIYTSHFTASFDDVQTHTVLL